MNQLDDWRFENMEYDARAADEAQDKLLEERLCSIRAHVLENQAALKALGKRIDAIRRVLSKHQYVLHGADNANGMALLVKQLSKEVPAVEQRLAEELKKARHTHMAMTITFVTMMLLMVGTIVLFV